MKDKGGRTKTKAQHQGTEREGEEVQGLSKGKVLREGQGLREGQRANRKKKR